MPVRIIVRLVISGNRQNLFDWTILIQPSLLTRGRVDRVWVEPSQSERLFHGVQRNATGAD